jgi:uncharacterized membrane protein YvlD (DUF360 family)
VQGALLFGLLGPLVGAWLVLAILMMADTHGGVQWHEVPVGMVMFGAFGYINGVVPAALAGLMAGFMRDRGRLRTVRASFLMAIVAAVLAALYGTWRVTDGNWGLAIWMFGVPGFAGGLCCALIFRAPGAAEFK